jgi:hypothetical protein
MYDIKVMRLDLLDSSQIATSLIPLQSHFLL